MVNDMQASFSESKNNNVETLETLNNFTKIFLNDLNRSIYGLQKNVYDILRYEVLDKKNY